MARKGHRSRHDGLDDGFEGEGGEWIETLW